jgi:hypothetical protein
MRYLVLAAVAAVLFGSAARVAQADTVINPGGNGDSLVLSTGVSETNQEDPYGGATTRDPDSAVVYPSGCKQVDIYAIASSVLFRTTIYKFHQVKHWCWHAGVVYDERHSWSFSGSATACLDTVYPANSWFFTWKWGKAQSGHFSEERAHITNCIFKVGSWKEMYPDVQIRAHADGSYDQSVRNE